MDRKAFLQALDGALAKLVPARERAEMIRYYEEYFDDAGPEGEASVIESLGDPAELAKKLAAEAGFSAPAAEPVQKKKRRVWPWVVLGIAVALALLIAACVMVFHVVEKVVDWNHPSVSTEQTAEPLQTPDSTGPENGDGIYGQEFTSIDVDAAVAHVTVQVGREYGVSVDWDSAGAYSLSYKFSNGVLKVTGSPQNVSGMNVKEAAVLITIPEGAVLKEIDIEVGVGDIILTNISAKDVSCDTGLGNMIWTGPLAREVELNTGMGDLSILTDGIDGWNIELNSGMGNLVVNGTEYSHQYRQMGVAGELEANTGMGNVTLKTN